MCAAQILAVPYLPSAQLVIERFEFIQICPIAANVRESRCRWSGAILSRYPKHHVVPIPPPLRQYPALGRAGGVDLCLPTCLIDAG